LFDVSGASATLLLKRLVELYRRKKTPTTRDVIKELDAFSAEAAYQRRLAEYNMAQALLRRLVWLEIDEERPAINLRGSEQVVIYDLSRLASVYLKTLYALVVLDKTYRDAVEGGATGHKQKTILVAEEAQNYVRARRLEEAPTIGERVVDELRAYGTGVLMVSPDPSQLPPHLSKDVAAVISIGYQGLPEFVVSLLQNFRYKDVSKLIRTTTRPRCYVYYRGRLRIKNPPRPHKRVIDLRGYRRLKE